MTKFHQLGNGSNLIRLFMFRLYPTYQIQIFLLYKEKSLEDLQIKNI